MKNIVSSKLAPYDILNTPPEIEFDAITHLASTICGAPMAFINLVQDDYHFFKSSYGSDARFLQHPASFCNYTIKNMNGGHFCVNDASTDVRFADNPLVVNEPYIRSYYGIPLNSANDQSEPLGTLCVLDTATREFTERETDGLQFLADYVCRLLELRKEYVQLRSEKSEIADQKSSLANYSHQVAHDIKGPLGIMSAFITLLDNETQDRLTRKERNYLRFLHKAVEQLVSYTDNLLLYANGEAADPAQEGNLSKSLAPIIEALQKDEVVQKNPDYVHSN